jgi:hypothetical protein
LGVGDGFSLKDWPLHLTVAPTFVIGTPDIGTPDIGTADIGTPDSPGDDIAADLAVVLSVIEPIMAAQPAVSVRAGSDAGFGHSGKIPVTLIEPSAELAGLHQRLVDELLAVGAKFDDPEFIGPGYRPHITVTRSNRVLLNDQLRLRQAALVDMAPAGDGRLRRVIWAHPLR